jgi:transcription initiation factor TFIIIB Brf1 subunit/transcription initiation factor TFIIB
MKCPKCSGDAVTPEGIKGEKVCPHCGLVLGKPLIVGGFTQWNPEWHSNWRETDTETLKEWLTTLRTVSCQLSIPQFPYREEAARTLRKGNYIFSQSQKFGKNKRATVAALIHLILKEYNKTRPIKDICQELSLDNTLVMKQAWILNCTIKTQNPIIKIERKTPKDYLTELGTKITPKNDVLRAAQETLEKAQMKGGNPIALASGALYHAYKQKKIKISKDKIGQAFGISPRTVDTNERKIRRLINTRKITTQTAPIITIR